MNVPIYKNKALLTAVAALVLNIAAFVVANYLPDPKLVELAKIVLVGLDSVAGILIANFAVETNAQSKVEIAKIQAQSRLQEIESYKPVK